MEAAAAAARAEELDQRFSQDQSDESQAGLSQSKLTLDDLSMHQHNVWVPANPFLTEQIPDWLYVYSRAPAELDAQLKWSLFGEEELHFYLAMVNRLYKEEAQELVLNYEAFRTVLQKEIERREADEVAFERPDERNIYNNVDSGSSNIYNNVGCVPTEPKKLDHHHYSNIADLSKELAQ